MKKDDKVNISIFLEDDKEQSSIYERLKLSPIMDTVTGEITGGFFDPYDESYEVFKPLAIKIQRVTSECECGGIDASTIGYIFGHFINNEIVGSDDFRDWINEDDDRLGYVQEFWNMYDDNDKFDKNVEYSFMINYIGLKSEFFKNEIISASVNLIPFYLNNVFEDVDNLIMFTTCCEIERKDEGLVKAPYDIINDSFSYKQEIALDDLNVDTDNIEA